MPRAGLAKVMQIKDRRKLQRLSRRRLVRVELIHQRGEEWLWNFEAGRGFSTLTLAGAVG